MASNNITKLNEADVPGAKFRSENISDHSVKELQRWLECRGLKRNGKKAELVLRCENCIKAGRGSEIDVAVDKGKWLDIKNNINVTSSVVVRCDNFPKPPSSLLLTFPSHDIPQCFNKGYIYYYLVESVKVNTADEDVNDSSDETGMIDVLTTDKALRRGLQYCHSEYVTNVKDCNFEEKYVVSAKVKSSFKQLFYNVFVYLSRNSGAVLLATCECKQSALGRCSHVAALLLFVLNHAEKHGHSALSSTSKSQQWGLGSVKKNRRKLTETEYPTAAKTLSRATFDPRPTNDQSQILTSLDINNFLASLEDHSESKTLWETILNYTYDDFTYSSEELFILKQQREMLLLNLAEHNKGRGICMIPDTENQRDSEAWFRWRSLLVTASSAKEVCGLQADTAKRRFCRQHIWQLDKIVTKSMYYGIKHEADALRDFKEALTLTNPLAVVQTTGLYMNVRFLGLGCSPDGIIIEGGVKQLLEIKCPTVLENMCPSEFNEKLTKTQLTNFCLRRDSHGYFSLKKSSPYYYQVQMSMAIMEINSCSFMVWSPKGFCVVIVEFDINFWNNIKNTLIDKHRNLIIPEYFAKRTPRNLIPVTI